MGSQAPRMHVACRLCGSTRGVWRELLGAQGPAAEARAAGSTADMAEQRGGLEQGHVLGPAAPLGDLGRDQLLDVVDGEAGKGRLADLQRRNAIKAPTLAPP